MLARRPPERVQRERGEHDEHACAGGQAERDGDAAEPGGGGEREDERHEREQRPLVETTLRGAENACGQHECRQAGCEQRRLRPGRQGPRAGRRQKPGDDPRAEHHDGKTRGGRAGRRGGIGERASDLGSGPREHQVREDGVPREHERPRPAQERSASAPPQLVRDEQRRRQDDEPRPGERGRRRERERAAEIPPAPALERAREQRQRRDREQQRQRIGHGRSRIDRAGSRHGEDGDNERRARPDEPPREEVRRDGRQCPQHRRERLREPVRRRRRQRACGRCQHSGIEEAARGLRAAATARVLKRRRLFDRQPRGRQCCAFREEQECERRDDHADRRAVRVPHPDGASRREASARSSGRKTTAITTADAMTRSAEVAMYQSTGGYPIQ